VTAPGPRQADEGAGFVDYLLKTATISDRTACPSGPEAPPTPIHRQRSAIHAVAVIALYASATGYPRSSGIWYSRAVRVAATIPAFVVIADDSAMSAIASCTSRMAARSHWRRISAVSASVRRPGLSNTVGYPDLADVVQIAANANLICWLHRVRHGSHPFESSPTVAVLAVSGSRFDRRGEVRAMESRTGLKYGTGVPRSAFGPTESTADFTQQLFAVNGFTSIP